MVSQLLGPIQLPLPLSVLLFGGLVLPILGLLQVSPKALVEFIGEWEPDR